MTKFCYFATESRYGFERAVLRELKLAAGELRRAGNEYTVVDMGWWDSKVDFWTDAVGSKGHVCSDLLADGAVICPGLNIARLQMDLALKRKTPTKVDP